MKHATRERARPASAAGDGAPPTGGRGGLADVLPSITDRVREIVDLLAAIEAFETLESPRDEERATTRGQLSSTLAELRRAQAALHRMRSPGEALIRGHRGLTDRESEVLALAAEGLGNAGIAEVLGISRRTVDKHFENLHAKLGTSRRAQLVAVALSRDFESA